MKITKIKKWKKVWNDRDAYHVKFYDKIHDVYLLKRKEVLSIIADNSYFIDPKTKIVIDLGCGTGAAAFSVLKRYKDAQAVLIDGSKPMIKKAKINAKELKFKIKAIHCELYDPGWMKKCRLKDGGQLIISSFMIHHLTDEEKYKLFRDIYDILIPGGTLIYADVLIMENRRLEEKNFNLWIEEIIENKKKAKMEYKSFNEEKSALLKSIEDTGDMPCTKKYILDSFKRIGFKKYEMIWFYNKFGIFKAVK